jgi:hypothetical protein
MKKILLLGALVLTFGLPAEAFGQWRVRNGARSGRITREEARVLHSQRRDIRRDRRSYRRHVRRDWRDDDRRRGRFFRRNSGFFRGTDRRRGNGYYRRGAGSPRHPVFGVNGRRGRRR